MAGPLAPATTSWDAYPTASRFAFNLASRGDWSAHRRTSRLWPWPNLELPRSPLPVVFVPAITSPGMDALSRYFASVAPKAGSLRKARTSTSLVRTN